MGVEAVGGVIDGATGAERCVTALLGALAGVAGMVMRRGLGLAVPWVAMGDGGVERRGAGTKKGDAARDQPASC